MPGSGLDTKISERWSFFFFFLGVHTAIEEPPGKVTEYLLAAPMVRFFPRTAHAEGGTQESLLIKSLA